MDITKINRKLEDINTTIQLISFLAKEINNKEIREKSLNILMDLTVLEFMVEDLKPDKPIPYLKKLNTLA